MIKEEKEAKLYDSSITRVQPVLRHLFENPSLAEGRLATLLENSPRGRHALSPDVIKESGIIESWCLEHSTKVPGRPSAFEKTVAPSEEFLQWLLKNPEKLEPPKSLGKSPETIARRKALLGRESEFEKDETIQMGLELLAEKGPDLSGRQWWALEGFTHVDCVIETEKLVLFIEGKRTDTSSKYTSWFPKRNQIARNLECAKAFARGKAFAVLMVVEKGKNEAHHYESVSAKHLLESWPHLAHDTESQGELLDAFLGIVTWQEILTWWDLEEEIDCLPKTIHDLDPTRKHA